jgi:FAD/FMN-containing dehydrogenase
MADPTQFVNSIKSEFPDDRLTWQKGIPTFHPESADEAAGMFRLAVAQRQSLYITGFGNNIDPVGEPFSEMVTVRTDRLNQCCEISKEDFFITVGGGYPLREINHRLKPHELYLPHAALPYVGSVGGAVSVGLTGFLHGHDVPIKKYLVMAEIVTPEGEVIRPGSKTFKSVSGYDVVKIFHGSWGLLGLIVTATFRVMPGSGAEDFAEMIQKGIERGLLLESLEESNGAPDAVYSRKIKEKFDPHGILPVVG